MKIRSFVLTCAAAAVLAFNVMAADPASPSAPAESAGSPKTAQAQTFIEKVNINKASASELAAALNGVGQKKAEAIVQFREQNGPFKSPQDLTQVQGIGEATLAKNQDRISIE